MHLAMELRHDEFHPSRRPWRTLVRVHDVFPEGGYCHVVVPAWNPHLAIRLCFADVPDDLLPSITTGSRLHAKVNIATASFEELHFDEWESE